MGGQVKQGGVPGFLRIKKTAIYSKAVFSDLRILGKAV